MLTVTELPLEPSGQVPIGDCSPTAKAGIEKADGNNAPPARPALACNKLRRESVPGISVRDIFISSRWNQIRIRPRINFGFLVFAPPSMHEFESRDGDARRRIPFRKIIAHRD